MSLVKRKKPSHDIFNKIYMEEMLEAYEKLVKVISSSCLRNVHYEIIPKQYQRAYCGEAFGEAFSETSGKTISKIVSNAFDPNNIQFNSKEYNIHAALEIMCNFHLAECLTKQLHKQKRRNKFKKEITTEKLSFLEFYDESEKSEDEKSIRTIRLENNIRHYQCMLEFVDVLYTTHKYKMLSENASSDIKETFRKRNLMAKDKYINMLELMLYWKKMDQEKKLDVYSKFFPSQLRKLKKLRDEIGSLRNAVRWYENDKEGSKRTEALTGFPTKLRNNDWRARCEMWKTETNAIVHLMEIQTTFYAQKGIVQPLKLHIEQLCNIIKTRVSKIGEYSSDTQMKIHNQLDYLTNMKREEYAEKLFLNFNCLEHPIVEATANTMANIDDEIQELAKSVKMKKEIQKQDYNIDQLEMKIIRHVIRTTTQKDVKNKKCDKTDSIYHNNTITHDTSSTAHVPRVPKLIIRFPNAGKITKESKNINNESTYQCITAIEEYKQNSQLSLQAISWKQQLMKLHTILIKWLKTHKPEKDLTKYETIFSTMVNNSFSKLYLEKESHANTRMEKAAHQMTLLLNNLKTEFVHVDANLSEITHQIKPPENKYSKSRAYSVKRCDTCKLNRSNLIDCTKYIVQMLYEENLNRFYILTTAMDQLSFLLYMMRTPIFKDSMSLRNQWSIKKIKSKIIIIRKKIREILRVKIDMMDFSLTKNSTSSNSANSINCCNNTILINQSNDKDMLKDLDSTPSCSTSENQNDDENDNIN